MLALAVRQPHAERIVSGAKTIEWRSRPTRIRGRVFVYASKTMDQAAAISYGIDAAALRVGVIVGTIEVVGCTREGDRWAWHLAAPERFDPVRHVERRPQPTWFRPFNVNERKI